MSPSATHSCSPSLHNSTCSPWNCHCVVRQAKQVGGIRRAAAWGTEQRRLREIGPCLYIYIYIWLYMYLCIICLYLCIYSYEYVYVRYSSIYRQLHVCGRLCSPLRLHFRSTGCRIIWRSPKSRDPWNPLLIGGWAMLSHPKNGLWLGIIIQFL